MNFLWPLALMYGGIGMIIFGALMMSLANDHMWTALFVLGTCVAVGSFVYGLYNGARKYRREMVELATCPVWCERNSPPDSCTCGRCRP